MKILYKSQDCFFMDYHVVQTAGSVNRLLLAITDSHFEKFDNVVNTTNDTVSYVNFMKVEIVGTLAEWNISLLKIYKAQHEPFCSLCKLLSTGSVAENSQVRAFYLIKFSGKGGN